MQKTVNMEDLYDATALEKMLIARASEKGVPISTTFELTPTCNLKCGMCYIRLPQSRLDELGGWRSLEEWKATALEMKKMGTLFILLTGGEPLLYPDFPELYEFLCKEGFIITINTNGTLITPRIAQLWKNQLPRRVNITLYGASEDTYEKLCHNRNGFQQCLKALSLMKAYGIPVKINFSMVKENQHEYDKMMQIASDLGFPVVADCYMLSGCNSLCQPARDINSHRLPPEEAAKFAVKQIAYEKGEHFEAFKEAWQKQMEAGIYSQQGPLGLECRAADTSCWIDFRGVMLPCDIMEEYGVSLKEYTVQEAWQKVRESRQKVAPHEECAGCTLKPACSVCWAIARQEKQVNGGLDYLCKMAREKHTLLLPHDSSNTEFIK